MRRARLPVLPWPNVSEWTPVIGFAGWQRCPALTRRSSESESSKPSNVESGSASPSSWWSWTRKTKVIFIFETKEFKKFHFCCFLRWPLRFSSHTYLNNGCFVMLIKNGKIKRPKNFKWTFTNWFIALFFHPNDVTFVLDSFSLFLSFADLSVEAITARTRKFLLLPRSLEKLFLSLKRKLFYL